jgi:endonuclease G
MKYIRKIFSIIIIVALLLFPDTFYSYVLKNKGLNQDNNNKLLLPKYSKNEIIVYHKYYTLSYSSKYRQARWVAYKLTYNDISSMNSVKRKNKFKVDNMVPNPVHPDEYKNSGFDRGHLCPAGDRAFSEEAMAETFYMSNISPQSPSFNRGIWKNLEEKIREWVRINKELYIVTGPVVKEKFNVIGKTNIAIPQYFYKVILDYKEPELKGIGFIFRNQKYNIPLTYFAVSIDSVEKFTGIDFFYEIPDNIKQKIEKSCDINKWFY